MSFLAIRKLRICIAYEKVFNVSTGYNPLRIISAYELDILGKTRPGQSQSVTDSVNGNVWKCLVLPGRLATATFFLPNTALITLDLPTLGYPTNPISTLSFLNYFEYNSIN